MKKEKSELKKQIEESLNVIRDYTPSNPAIGVILGTGLDGFAKEIQPEVIIPYENNPHFPISTVEFHSGKLIFGKVHGKDLVAMQGRFHFYEGYTMRQITYPVRLMKFLGVKTLLVCNACGSVNPFIRKGDIMLIDDHINLLGGNPLIGPNDDSIGIRFPDMSEPYSKHLISLAEKIALEKNIKLHKGIYAAMSGPSLETRAEYRMLRLIGADVVGMSTVPEVIVAHQMGINVLGFSIITDECYPDALKPADINDIIQTAMNAEPFLTTLLLELIQLI
jgi:purine-nucleoside phosphorylase